MDYKQLGFRTQEACEFPPIVNVEVYHGDCPCRCVHCPVGIARSRNRVADPGPVGMELALFEKILREMASHSHTMLRIHSTGEPLLWRDLPEALHLLAGTPVGAWIFTSGVTGDKSILEVVCSATRIVEVSINSITPGDYRATKGIDAFEQVVKNMRHMRDVIASKGLGTRLLASRVESSDRRADEEFVRYWKASGLVHDAFVRSYHSYNGLLEEPDRGRPLRRREPCLVHWARFNIGVRGHAVVCFNELFKETLPPGVVLGDLHEQTIADLWHGTRLTEIRRSELSDDHATGSGGDALPCKDCRFCQPLTGARQTSEHQIRQWSCQHAKSVPGAPGV